jgi:hypothetical protein
MPKDNTANWLELVTATLDVADGILSRLPLLHMERDRLQAELNRSIHQQAQGIVAARDLKTKSKLINGVHAELKFQTSNGISVAANQLQLRTYILARSNWQFAQATLPDIEKRLADVKRTLAESGKRALSLAMTWLGRAADECARLHPLIEAFEKELKARSWKRWVPHAAIALAVGAFYFAGEIILIETKHPVVSEQSPILAAAPAAMPLPMGRLDVAFPYRPETPYFNAMPPARHPHGRHKGDASGIEKTAAPSLDERCRGCIPALPAMPLLQSISHAL